ncbi:MAG: hypothetical protein ACXW1M_00410, partial [Acidimicrobiia bacterium]
LGDHDQRGAGRVDRRAHRIALSMSPVVRTVPRTVPVTFERPPMRGIPAYRLAFNLERSA